MFSRTDQVSYSGGRPEAALYSETFLASVVLRPKRVGRTDDKGDFRIIYPIVRFVGHRLRWEMYLPRRSEMIYREFRRPSKASTAADRPHASGKTRVYVVSAGGSERFGSRPPPTLQTEGVGKKVFVELAWSFISVAAERA